MRVNLGTREFDDEARKAVRKDMGRRGGHATRAEVKEWVEGLVDERLHPAPADDTAAEEDDSYDGQ